MTTLITVEQLGRALAEVVAEAGSDYQYVTDTGTEIRGRCVYQRDGAPSCMVGHALFKLGVPVDVLAQLDVASEDGEPCAIDDSDAYSVLSDAGFVLDSEAAERAAMAQTKQDSGWTWGAALREYDPLHTPCLDPDCEHCVPSRDYGEDE